MRRAGSGDPRTALPNAGVLPESHDPLKLWPTGQRLLDPPSAKWRTKTPKTCVFLGDFDPFRNTVRHGGSLAVDLGDMDEP